MAIGKNSGSPLRTALGSQRPPRSLDMDRGHIAFLSFPHPPHVNPTVPIVSVLVRRGFRVSYVTSQRFRDRLLGVGAEVIACQSFDAQADHQFHKETDQS